MTKTNKAGVSVSVGSKWEMVSISQGSPIQPFKVMGFVDDWVVMRRKNCIPVCKHLNTFGTEYVAK
jgi:hypothetical protein